MLATFHQPSEEENSVSRARKLCMFFVFGLSIGSCESVERGRGLDYTAARLEGRWIARNGLYEGAEYEVVGRDERVSFRTVADLGCFKSGDDVFRGHIVGNQIRGTGYRCITDTFQQPLSIVVSINDENTVFVRVPRGSGPDVRLERR